MPKQSIFYNLLRFVPVVILGAFIMALSFSASTVQAETVNEEQAVGCDTTAVSADDGGGAVIVLMGGMLLIIIAVVLSVVATVVSSVAAVEAGDEA